MHLVGGNILLSKYILNTSNNINTDEIPSELAFVQNMISSHMKITCYLQA